MLLANKLSRYFLFKAEGTLKRKGQKKSGCETKRLVSLPSQESAAMPVHARYIGRWTRCNGISGLTVCVLLVAAFAQHGPDGLVDTFADGIASGVVATGS